MSPIKKTGKVVIGGCVLAWAGTVPGQEFQDLRLEEELETTVKDGTASEAQFDSLKQQTLETLTPLFEERFVVDGVYGEQKDGRITKDWEALGKAAGVSGMVLAAAYATWRRKKQAEYQRWRTADEAFYQQYFEKHFSAENPTAKAPTTADWQALAKEKGLLGGAGLLAALYATWRQKKQTAQTLTQATRFGGTQQLLAYQELYQTAKGNFWNQINQQINTWYQAEVKSISQHHRNWRDRYFALRAAREKKQQWQQTARDYWNTQQDLETYPKKLKDLAQQLKSTVSQQVTKQKTDKENQFQNELKKLLITFSPAERKQILSGQPVSQPLPSYEVEQAPTISSATKKTLAQSLSRLQDQPSLKDELFVNNRSIKYAQASLRRTSRRFRRIYLQKIQTLRTRNHQIENRIRSLQGNLKQALSQDLQKINSSWDPTAKIKYYQALKNEYQQLLEQWKQQAYQQIEQERQRKERSRFTSPYNRSGRYDSRKRAHRSVRYELRQEAKNKQQKIDQQAQEFQQIINFQTLISQAQTEQKARQALAAKKELEDKFLGVDQVDYRTPLEEMFPAEKESSVPPNSVLQERYTRLLSLKAEVNQSSRKLQGLKTGIINYQKRLRRGVSWRYRRSILRTLPRLIASVPAQEKLLAEKTAELSSLITSIEGGRGYFVNQLKKTQQEQLHQINQQWYAQRKQLKKNWYQAKRSRSWRTRRYADHNYQSSLKYYQNYYRQKSAEVRTSFRPTIQKLETAWRQEVSERKQKEAARQAKIAAYQKLRQQSPYKERALNFLRQLETARESSHYFQQLSSNLEHKAQYDQALSKLQQELVPASGRANEIAQLKQKLAQGNQYTFAESLAKDPARSKDYHIHRYRWMLERSWRDQRRSIGSASNLYWNRKYSRYAGAIARSRQGYSEHSVKVLKKLAEKAHAEKMRTYNGWERFYRYHPYTYQARKQEWQRRLYELQKAESDRKLAIQQQIDSLQTAQKSYKQQLASSANWLASNVEERENQPLTNNIVAAEFNETSAKTPLSPAEQYEQNRVLRQANEAIKKQQLDQYRSMVSNRVPKFDPDRAIAGVVKTMRYYSSDKGKAARAAYYDRQAENYQRQQTQVRSNSTTTTRAANGSIRTTINPIINKLKKQVTYSTTAIIAKNGRKITPPPPTNPAKVELVSQFQGMSSENPRSVVQARAAVKRYKAAQKKAEELKKEPAKTMAQISTENLTTSSSSTAVTTSASQSPTTKDPTQQMLQDQMALTKAKLEQDLRKILVKIGKTEEAPKPATVLNKQFSAEKSTSAVIPQAKMLGEAFGEALNEVFPGEVVGESIATFLVNIGKKKELETFKEKLTNKYPEQKELIEQLEVEELLTKYPEGKSIAVDLGWITLDLAGGAILKVFGKSLKVAKYLTLDKSNFSWLEKLKNLGGTITEKWAKLFGKSPIATKTQPVSKFAQKIHANLDQIIKHIMRGDVNKIPHKGTPNINVTGVHSNKALKKLETLFGKGNVKITKQLPTPENYPRGFYDAEIKVFDKELYKTQRKIKDPRPDSELGWKKKSSTMFPNGWSELKIRQAILEAAENAKKVTDPMDPKKKATRGFTKEGIPLEFRVDNSPPSVFPNFDIKSWK